MMDKKYRKMADLWVRSIEVYDDDDDGIGEVRVGICVRDDEAETRRIFSSMSIDDAKDILSSFAGMVYPCEDFAEDWDDPEASGFGVTMEWDDEWKGIRLHGFFRT